MKKLTAVFVACIVFVACQKEYVRPTNGERGYEYHYDDSTQHFSKHNKVVHEVRLKRHW